MSTKSRMRSEEARATVPKRDQVPAGLVWVSDRDAGIRRQRRGAGFSYRDSTGSRVSDPATLQRIRRLAIPPAYRDVWICALADGHLQATGIDARGRKQYRYHARWQAERGASKFERLLEVGRALPRIRRRVSQDLRGGQQATLARVLAALVRLTSD
jgi:DNA topoisomerase-1